MDLTQIESAPMADDPAEGASAEYKKLSRILDQAADALNMTTFALFYHREGDAHPKAVIGSSGNVGAQMLMALIVSGVDYGLSSANIEVMCECPDCFDGQEGSVPTEQEDYLDEPPL